MFIIMSDKKPTLGSKCFHVKKIGLRATKDTIVTTWALK